MKVTIIHIHRVIFLNIVVLLTMLSCKKNNAEELRQQMQTLSGEWKLERVVTEVSCPDEEATLKIRSNMESEMTIIKQYIHFEDNGNFTTSNKIDSLLIQAEGIYTLNKNKIQLEFKQGDSMAIAFDFEYKINGDSLYIVNNDLLKIKSNIEENNFSDNNLKLLYGIKDRGTFQLDNAVITKVFSKVH